MSTGARDEGTVEPAWARPAFVSKRYGIPLGTLYDKIEEGVVPASRFGRGVYIRLADMDELMASNRVARGVKAAS